MEKKLFNKKSLSLFYLNLLRMRNLLVLFLIIWGSLTLGSCFNGKNDELSRKLVQWDQMIDEQPEAVADSLQKLIPQSMSRSNRAYYNLINTITKDKLYYEFTSDSLIDKAVNYYRVFDSKNDNYIRSLIYKGIVRTRMGAADSTVFEPLKQAEDLFAGQRIKNPSIGYTLNYFLGNLQYLNNNFETANSYYSSALDYATIKQDTTHIFDAYLSLFWNEITDSNVDKSEVYLDSLSKYYDESSGNKTFLLNAQSAYYESTGNMMMAIEREKEQLEFTDGYDVKDKSSTYFSISKKYNKINQPDSALLYGILAIEAMSDNLSVENYLFYENVADIYENMGDYNSANTYKHKSMDSYRESVLDRLDTQIMELEKKYDLSKTENVVLKSKQRVLIIAIVSLVVALTLTAFLLISIRRSRTSAIKLINLQHENERHAMETRLLEEEAHKTSWLISLYGYISNRLSALQDNFENLSQRYISANPKVYKEMMNILDTAEDDLKNIPEQMNPTQETFELYTGLSGNESQLFNSSERIMLMLLACDADNKQIATFMNASLQSIRARKSQLKRKMLQNEIKADKFFK